MSYTRHAFHICYVCLTYVWRIIDSLFVSSAYQRRTYGLTRVSTANVLRTSYMYIRLLWIMCLVFCGVPRLCLCICNCVIKIASWSFFHSRGSDVSNGPGCRMGLFQVFVHGSLCMCWGRLTNTMGSYWRCFPPSTQSFYFSVHQDYLDYLW